MQHCRRFAWRRLRVINRCSAARRPQYEIVSKVTQYENEDVSHAAAVVDEDKIPVRVTPNIKWLQFVKVLEVSRDPILR